MLEPTGAGDYRLRNLGTNQVASGGPRDGSQLLSVPDDPGSVFQRWRVESRPGGWKTISTGSGRCPDLYDPDVGGTSVFIRRCGAFPSQLWNLPAA